MEDAFGLMVLVGFWLISALMSQLKKRKGEPPPAPEAEPAPARRPVRVAPPPPRPPSARSAPPPPPPPAAKPQDALAELLRSFGVDVDPASSEEPVASEHRRTAGEHAATPSETRATASEHRHTPGWHDRTASETRTTPSEHVQAASERRRTAGEHVGGDVVVPAVRLAPVPSVGARRTSAFGRRIVADLRGGRKSLARAMVLREILGPPVGMRSPDERGTGV